MISLPTWSFIVLCIAASPVAVAIVGSAALVGWVQLARWREQRTYRPGFNRLRDPAPTPDIDRMPALPIPGQPSLNGRHPK